MPQNYYILKSGKLRRKGNTLYLKTAKELKAIPVNNINSLYCFGEVDVNSKLLIFLSANKIPVHFFNYYGFYVGSYYPREYLNSGSLLVKQVEHFLDKEKRAYIARQFLEAALSNMVKNLEHYKKHGKAVGETIKKLKEGIKKLAKLKTRREFMGIEGNARRVYYKSFSKILRGDFKFEKRTRQPPKNMLNALISFGNSLLYTVCLTEIYHTQLNPTISYLHEPSERRFSLALDLAEIFKPLIVDRVIFKLINNRKIYKKHFDKTLNYCYLTSFGKRLFLEEFDSKLKVTLKHRSLKRQVSYLHLIRLECYKLIKHLIADKLYKAFKIWW